MTERYFPAQLDQLAAVQAFVEEQASPCPAKEWLRLAVAVEEVFVNIARYAYPAGPGQVLVRCWAEDAPRRLAVRFQDTGVPFDPLARQDADITRPAEQRQVGGLGILMVKKLMDQVTYAHEDGQNVLTLYKTLP